MNKVHSPTARLCHWLYCGGRGVMRAALIAPQQRVVAYCNHVSTISPLSQTSSIWMLDLPGIVMEDFRASGMGPAGAQTDLIHFGRDLAP
jgi:hypothetical protein